MAQRDLVLKSQAQQDRKADKPQKFRAVIVDSAGNRTGTGSPWKSHPRRLVWFQAWGSGSIGWAVCTSIEPRLGLPIIIKNDDFLGIFLVESEDPLIRSDDSDTDSFQALTEGDFARGGKFQLWIEPEMIQPLSIYPGTGLAVNIVSGRYEYLGTIKTFDGATEQSISASQPAGPNEHCLVGFYLDSSNALQQVVGSTVSTSSDAPEPSWPAGAFQLGVVDLDDSQTTIDLANDIDNRRVLFTQAAAGEGYPFSFITVDDSDTDADHDNLEDAITAASAGGTILFNGTFTITGSSLALNKPITLQGINPETSIITSALGTATVDVTAAATIRNCSVLNTASSTESAPIRFNAAVTMENVIVGSSGSNSTGSYGIWIIGGAGWRITNCRVSAANAGTRNNALRIETAASNGVVEGGYFDGPQADIFINHASAVVEFINPQFANDILSHNAGTINGSALDSQGRDCGIIVVNNSGSSLSPGAVGYLDENGDFLTTTTAEDTVSWHISPLGGIDGQQMFAKNRGLATVPYTGSAPSDGDFLTTSTTAGSGQARSTMHPSIFAVCTAAGSGGTVGVLLLAGRVTLDTTSDDFVVDIANASESVFEATIDSISGDKVYYNTPSSGDVSCITPNDTGELGKIVLHNTSLPGEAYIIATGSDGGGDFIQVSNSADVSGWSAAEDITGQSQTNSDLIQSSAHFFDVYLPNVPGLAVGIILGVRAQDSAGKVRTVVHPFEAGSFAKRKFSASDDAGGEGLAYFSTPIINSRFTVSWTATGTATARCDLRLAGYRMAVP